MTLPDERARALYKALEFMQELLDPKKTPKVPKKVRQRAYSVLKHYPRDYHLNKIVESSPNILKPPKRMADGLKIGLEQAVEMEKYEIILLPPLCPDHLAILRGKTPYSTLDSENCVFCFAEEDRARLQCDLNCTCNSCLDVV